MKLYLENVARILSAEIKVDGLTVIAGKNNTGKSTIGKTLFALFNAFYNIQEKVSNKRRSDIQRVCQQQLRNYTMQCAYKNASARATAKIYYQMPIYMTNEIAKALERGETPEIEQIVLQVLERYEMVTEDESAMEELQNGIRTQVLEKMQIRDEKIISEVVERYFRNVFNEQINCQDKIDESAHITLDLKTKRVELEFAHNSAVRCESDINILHEAFFIDNPFAIDEVDMEVDYAGVMDSIMQQHLVGKLSANNDDIMDGVFEAVLAKEKLGELYELLGKAVDGDIVVRNNELSFVDAAHKNSVYLRNLSTGLKSFLIIKMLLEKGILKERDILILDEPEIHLHPEWQLLYAEIVVLLQKQFDLSVVLTTHSSQFLEALDYYSQKHGIIDKCHYYLASVQNGYSEFEEVTGNLEKIYKQMVTPSILLDQLKYELNRDKDDEI